jgi:hypothetical protein
MPEALLHSRYKRLDLIRPGEVDAETLDVVSTVCDAELLCSALEGVLVEIADRSAASLAGKAVGGRKSEAPSGGSNKRYATCDP